MTRQFVYAIIFGTMHLFALASSAHAQGHADRDVDLHKGEGFGSIDSYVSTYLETAEPLSIDDVIKLSKAGQFEPVETNIADFGYYKKGIWLKVSLRNETQEKLEQLLVLHTNFMRDIDVYFVNDAKTENILHQQIDSDFDARPIKYHQLVAPLEISRLAEGELDVRYESEGETVLP